MQPVKLLIVAFSDSIHTARWISQLDRSKFEIHLFPSVPFRQIHPFLENITIWQWQQQNDKQGRGLRFKNPSIPFYVLEKLIGSSYAQKIAIRFPKWQQISLLKTIRMLKPDIIHSMETQQAGYLLSKSRSLFKNINWVHSTWGIDLHYFYTFPDHREKLVRLMSQIEILVAEGERDIEIARGLEFIGKSVVIPSVGGSFDFELFDSLDSKLTPSSRTKILLKGYEGEERLASYALKALRSIREQLLKYEVFIYSCSYKLMPLIGEIQRKKEFVLKIIPNLEYKQLLTITAQSRISITNNLSDGVPNTMLEAMALGAFPIQSNTAITEGWIEDGKNGLLTNPKDINQIAEAVSKALTDDRLVDTAAVFNSKLIKENLNSDTIKIQIEDLYKTASGKSKIGVL